MARGRYSMIKRKKEIKMKVNTSMMLVYIILDICFVNKPDISFSGVTLNCLQSTVFLFVFNILMQSILDFKPTSPRSEFYLFFYKCLFGCIRQVFVAAHGIFLASCRLFCCGTWI